MKPPDPGQLPRSKTSVSRPTTSLLIEKISQVMLLSSISIRVWSTNVHFEMSRRIPVACG